MRIFLDGSTPSKDPSKNQKSSSSLTYECTCVKNRDCFLENIWPEMGRHGSPRADIRRGRSHGLQEGFWIPPGPLGFHIYIKNEENLGKPQNEISKNMNFPGVPISQGSAAWAKPYSIILVWGPGPIGPGPN